MMNGIPVTIKKAKEQLSLYRHGLKAMSGGLTLSGGEPLMQDRFAVKLFSVAKELDIHTALDTNGYLGDRLSDEELEKIDMVLLDLKTFDPERHLHITGKEVAPTHTFARRLGQRKKRIWVRYVLVPGLTDDAKDIEKTAQFAAELGTVERVDVLPFHQMGRFKWAKLGLNYTLDNTQPPSNELIERTCAQFRAVGLKAY
jgi:pyruvate formate lyase activating enzyme